MTILTTMLQADLTAIIADLPCVLVWGNQTISATRSESAQIKETSDDMGEIDAFDLECVASRSSFSGGVLPAVSATVSVDGVNYFVAERRLAPDGIAVEFRMKREVER